MQLRFIRATVKITKTFLLESRPIMTTAGNSRDHIIVTKDEPRAQSLHRAVVSSLKELSPTVRGLQLKVLKSETGDEFKFLPGQWLDIFIPGIETIGGFSITSTPKELTETGLVGLAVKYSDWAPTLWFHTKCTVGSEVSIRGGGKFTLPLNPTGDLVFVAGGVGINPLASMISHLGDIQYGYSLTLLYSAKTAAELIFKECFDAISNRNPRFRVLYFLTGSKTSLEGAQERRLNVQDLASYIGPETVLYVCGPTPLIDLVESQRDKCKNVIFEKWW